jgi:beta-glucuronidase
MVWPCLLLLTVWWTATHGLLYPAESETRQIRSLDGLWSFRLDEEGVGESEQWFSMPNLPEPTILMPVPASYNDITQNITIHQHIGWVWYARDFFIQNREPRWVLRFEGAHYETHVWVNGQSAVNHSGGYLPFEADINPFIPSGSNYSKVHVVVAINNTLTPATLPPGELVIHSSTYRELQTQFDFFNYAGIDHSVILYSTSSAYIQDIAIDTQSIDYDDQHVATSAILTYSVTIGGANQTNTLHVLIELLDADGMVVTNNTDSQSRLLVDKPNLWEPCGMNHTHPCTEESYLYKLQVTLYNDASRMNVLDIYRIPHIGIRTIRLTDSKFLVNERPFYFHGVNAHEDSDIRGRGFDQVILAKHFNLYAWLHGNAFRTSHYPYAEEFYHMADRFGIAVIDQTPAIGLNKVEYFSEANLEHHKKVVTELISRDRNHPSVLMWTLANEPSSYLSEAKTYLSTLVNFTRPIAAGRPLTFVTNQYFNGDHCVQFFDVICINRYIAWYKDYGRLDQITNNISQDISNWRNTYPTKPILVSEYGADTIPGLHNDPPLMFTEEYQKEFYSAYHDAFDNVSSLLHPDTGYFIGELPWTMFDFAADQSIMRISGINHKGLFTRQRQPKAAAFLIKSRYEQHELVPTTPRKTL